jgi:hypothetical protein
MTPEQLAKFEAEILMLRCRLNGMVAENIQRQIQGESVAYGQEHFNKLHGEIRAVFNHYTA